MLLHLKYLISSLQSQHSSAFLRFSDYSTLVTDITRYKDAKVFDVSVVCAQCDFEFF